LPVLKRQSFLPSLDFQKSAVDQRKAQALIKEKKQQAAHKGKKKQQSKRSQKVAGITSAHATLCLLMRVRFQPFFYEIMRIVLN